MSLPEPITRKEQYYDGIARGNASKLPEPITREEQYLEYIAKNGGGGGGGTTDYEALDNKPSVNSVELSGNKTLDDLGIQGKLTFDNEPTEGSQNPVKSGGVYDVLESLVDAISEKPDEYADLTDKPSINSVELSGNKTASELGLQAELDGAQTVSGNPITITDAEAMNAESVVVELEPKQDLHGYDAPWVGGSGKNKLPLVLADIKTVNTSGTWSGNTYTLNGVTFEVLTDSADNVLGVKVNGTASASTNFGLTDKLGDMSGLKYNGAGAGTTNNKCLIVGYWDAQGEWIGDGRAYGGNDYTLLDYPQMSFGIYVQNTQTLTDETFYPMIRLSTESDPTFTPYSNICPITGYSEVNVERVGKNLFAPANYAQDSFDGTTYTDVGADGIISQPITLSAGTYVFSLKLLSLPSADRTLAFTPTQYGDNLWSLSHLETKTVGELYQGTVTLESETTFSSWLYGSGGGTFKIQIQIESGNQATTYEPYQGSTATISLGGTKYGGTLDVTEGGYSDEWGFATLDGTETWVLQNNSRVSTVVSDNMTNSRTSGNLICSAFETRTPDDTWFGVYGISCQDDGTVSIGGITDVSEFTTWLSNNPIQIAYRKKTPSSISTTPTDIPLLENTNNVSTDGTNITLKYQPNNVIGECKVYTDEQIEKVLPPLPTTDGTYHLSCEVTSGVGVLSWVSDS